MKKLTFLFILLYFTGFYGQKILDENMGAAELPGLYWPDTTSLSKKNEVMHKALSENKVKSEEFDDLTHVLPGYYIIANVFRNTRYLDANLKKLQNISLEAGSIFNDKKDLHYLYLKRYDRWEDALEACISDLNGTYAKDKWIMIVRPNTANTYPGLVDYGNLPGDSREDGIPIEAVTYEMLTSLGTQGTSPNGKPSPAGNPWIWRADEFFDKLWYAEAVELYEKALERDPNIQDKEILQKVGDAHYFNTNMERANFWYQKLYDSYTEGMDADYLFRYAHTLKGTGKYAKAKRVLRSYDGKRENPESRADSTAAHLLLDHLLEKEYNITLKNLSINSVYSDFGPMFYNGDEIVYSSARKNSGSNTRRYKWNDQPFLDLYTAKIAAGSQDLKDPVRLSKTINTKYHEAAVSYSPDYSTMYFTRNNFDKGSKRGKERSNSLKIYVSKKIDGEWTKAKELPFNNEGYSMGHPALSPDGKKLYFISDMPGSIGETDIFVVDVLGDGKYSRPKNLGPDINTDRKEMFPFMGEKKLYFSSDGRVGLGGLDIYEAELDEEGGFRPAINLGRPINSERDDFSYIIAENIDQGYFASNRNGGQGDDDLYSFERKMEEKKARNSITGTIDEPITGDFVPNALVSLLKGDKIVNEVVTNEKGSFAFDDLDPEATYTIRVSKGEFFDQKIAIGREREKQVHVNVPMKKLKELIVLEDGVKKLKTDMIHFDFDKFHIRKDASLELDKLVAVMKEYKDMVIKIESHTDSRGDAVYNQYLSDRRAKSTRDYIISKGISKDRLQSAIGYGEAQLINECKDGVPCSRQTHESNRRSEFIIVKM